LEEHDNPLGIKQELGSAELKPFGGAHELQEARDRKAELVEEINAERLEERGSHLKKKCFQVSAVTLEPK